KSHGYMINRFERSDEHNHHVSEVVQFEEPEPGLWIPAVVTVRSQPKGNPNVTRLAHCGVDVLEINKPIDESLLTFNFPEGAKVFESPAHWIHVWGKESPTRTFTSDEEFRDYLY